MENAAKNENLKRLASVIQVHGIISADKYDSLKIDKPGRRTIYRYFGQWKNAVNTAVKYLNNNGLKIGLNGNNQTHTESIDAEEQVLKLQRQVQELTRHIQTPKLCLEGSRLRAGALGDSHLGSLYADKALLSFAYEVFKKEGIKTVLHTGDICDGIKMYKGHEFELEAHGSDAQVNLVCDKFPQHKGIKTYFIRGNHDFSFYKHGGTDIGKQIAQRREDLECIGHQEADITIGRGKNMATIRLYHPDGGTAYAISYNPQKYIAELPSGTKPDVLLIGHYHKAEKLFYRGVCAIQTGTTQMQTPFMRGRKISAAMGFWIIELVVAPERMVSLKSEFYPVRT